LSLNILSLDGPGPEGDHGHVLLLELDGAVGGHPVAGRLADAVGHVEDVLPAAEGRHVDDKSGLLLGHQPEVPVRLG
jgi:hypothetical protein